MQEPLIVRQMAAVADVTRCRLLRILERQEFTVGELCGALQLPQSTVSRHLKTLADDGWVVSRAAGTSHFYRMAPADAASPAAQLWTVVAGQLAQTPAAEQDDRRLAEVLQSRRTRSREFFSSAAGRWDRLREELFGRSVHLQALPALLDERWAVGDFGCGTGQVAQALAPYVRQVIAVDGSAEMLAAARERLCPLENVELRQGELEALPIETATLDAALLVLVLHYVADPARVLGEAARVLRPGGRLLVLELLPHDREEYGQQMGHVWPGFAAAEMSGLLASAGFTAARCHPLPPDPEARGPALFVARARREEGSG